MANNVDFTNERPYDQYEHARALKSACNNRIEGMNYSNGRIESGYGIIFGSPFQLDATTVSGSGYITITIELQEQGDNGIGTIKITNESTRQNVDNNYIKKYSIYKVDGNAIVEDYRQSDIIKSVNVSGSTNKINVSINGVKSNDYTLPLTSGGNVDLSNYYTKQETTQQIRNAKIDYEFKMIWNVEMLKDTDYIFNPKDFNFLLIGNWSDEGYINYVHPIYHNQFSNSRDTTFTFGEQFFTKGSGDIASNLMRIRFKGLNQREAAFVLTAYRADINGNVDYTSYIPNKVIGVKMVVK